MDPQFEIRILVKAEEFLGSLDEAPRRKVIYNLRKAQSSHDPELFKKLDGDIWEFRTTYNGIRYRLLAFWDKRDNKNTLVVCTHGIVKKVSKVPAKEIEKARGIMESYFTNG